MTPVKIGWLDHHLYTHHSEVYVPMIRAAKEPDGSNSFQIIGAYESDRDSNRPDWCEELGVARMASPEEVVEASDVLLVAAPNNPEAHLELSRVALASGKPVYVDKYLSHSVDDAREMVHIARDNNTPVMTSSALRCATELQQLMDTVAGPYDYVFARGMGRWRMHYGVHTIALALRAFGPYVKRLCDTGTELDRAVMLDDGARRCSIECHLSAGQETVFPWEIGVRTDDTVHHTKILLWDEFYLNLVRDILQFFRTGESPISLDEQFATVAIEHTAQESLMKGGIWLDVPRLD